VFVIGPWIIHQPTILAPMAGVTDLPLRQLCREVGAGLAVSEMLTSDVSLWKSRKSQSRLAAGDSSPRSIQLLGNDPRSMAEAAKINADSGADIIDINMGCPAKKVCKKVAGSALLKDEKLVGRILSAVVDAVDIPVTLKIRTGWDLETRNGPQIAQIAESAGIQALAVHGRTRACAFKNTVEYDTIAEIVSRLKIPVFANGDITTVEQSQKVLKYTGAQAVMIGRAALGNPWFFREINYYLKTGKRLAPPTLEELSGLVSRHLSMLHNFYGETIGIKFARKHIGWYLDKQIQQRFAIVNLVEPKKKFNQIECAQDQISFIRSLFSQLEIAEEKAA
jgi:tRNA-dihydrouridine synthase B